MLSVMKRSRRHETMMSSETGESLERSVRASKRWCALMVADDSLFIVGTSKADEACSIDFGSAFEDNF